MYIVTENPAQVYQYDGKSFRLVKTLTGAELLINPWTSHGGKDPNANLIAFSGGSQVTYHIEHENLISHEQVANGKIRKSEGLLSIDYVLTIHIGSNLHMSVTLLLLMILFILM